MAYNPKSKTIKLSGIKSKLINNRRLKKLSLAIPEVSVKTLADIEQKTDVKTSFLSNKWTVALKWLNFIKEMVFYMILVFICNVIFKNMTT